MEIERVSEQGGRVALYAYDWDIHRTPAAKINRRFLGYEQPLHPDQAAAQQVQEAICWSYGRTLGNIAVFNEDVVGAFPAKKGDDAILACDIVDAGKYRHGAKRWWCRTHQKHWGTKADIAAASRDGAVRCSNHSQPMSYVINPPHIQIADHAEVGIWCSMPAALTSKGPAPKRRPKIHVHVRDEPGGHKVIDQDFEALSLHYNPEGDLFGNDEITKVHVTPPAALEFVRTLEYGLPTGCINCSHCGCPHLDLGDFARTAHSKHLCGNCGRDSTWSSTAMASTPLSPLHDQFNRAASYVDVEKVLNIDEYAGAGFALWASTPAVLWTAERSQERGIHVHLAMDGHRIIDDTFGTVIYQGKKLDRAALLENMLANTVV
jgi:transposase-like protein